ncbi:FkbM family methyltransferase [Persicimonas caeni]|uniref:FkbM family methyltransferase n=1 Tax=Persicimonas caeni TaxID=2292766 RepID=A0A4Y6PTW7_PERCE|nr:FkbM family methyltransferase [Persicimonas caeni]QDG51690.1 FkbM family methyltransferase [Persicimonas caeni]QED32911.1 FkbM family methyltransferase [Persicimonas caeni]
MSFPPSVQAMSLRDFIPLDLKTAVARRMCSDLVGNLVGAIFNDRIPSWDCHIDTSSPRIDGPTKASVFWRLYEGSEIRFIRSQLRADLDVVEVGGSIGVVSCHIRRRLAPHRRLFVVEADPELATIADNNLRSNHPKASFEVLNRAVSYHPDADGLVRFARSPANVSGRLAEDTSQDVVEVGATTLGGLVEEKQIDEFVLVSDIEGAEAQLLDQDAEILRDRCRQIVIELHETQLAGTAVGIDDLVATITDLGFALDARRGPVCVFSADKSEKRQ